MRHKENIYKKINKRLQTRRMPGSFLQTGKIINYKETHYVQT